MAAWERVDQHVASFGVTVMTRAVTVYAIAQGVNILASGRGRFANNTYESALSLPGAPESWGVALAVAGVVAVVGLTFHSRRILVVGLFVQGVWSAFFALTFLAAWWRHLTAASTAHFAYALISLLCFHLAAMHIGARTPPDAPG